jgi:putative oxidoreductase
LIFLNSGIGKVGNFAGTEKYMAQFGMPWSSFFLLGAIFLELVGSITVILGYFTRFGALFLIVFLIPATLIFHSDFSERIQMRIFSNSVDRKYG